jgi:hypothetical protein
LSVALEGAISRNNAQEASQASLNAGRESFAGLLEHHCGDFWLNADQGIIILYGTSAGRG